MRDRRATTLWIDGGHDPAENMRRDAALLEAAEAGASPVLRLFGFRPPGITLGRAQAAERVLDLERCRRDGVPWARRPTGGRAIFHADEWTFSLAARLDDPAWGGSASDSYARLAEVIAAALRRLGVPAELARGTRGRGGEPAASAACFAASARHEILLEGRKLVGLAQRRTRVALLQQGSILRGASHVRLADYLAADDRERAAVRRNLALVTAHAADWLAEDVSDRTWARAVEAALPVPAVLRESEAAIC